MPRRTVSAPPDGTIGQFPSARAVVSGVTVHLQALVFGSGDAHVSNAIDFLIE